VPATAILVDATLVRGILLPAGMAVLGERTCYLPWRLVITRREPAAGIRAS